MSESEELYDEIVDKIETPSTSLLLIKLLMDQGKTEVAIKACLRALEIFPDDMNIRRLLAETYLNQGSVDLAEKELEKLASKINELSSIFKLQANLFRKEDRLKEALRSLQLYLAHHGEDKEAARLLSELGSAGKEEQPVLPTPTLAEIYFNQGALEEAIKVYEHVIKASPDDEKSKMRLSELRRMKAAEGQERSDEPAKKEKTLRLLGILEGWLKIGRAHV